jgi:chromosome segregation ATPase
VHNLDQARLVDTYETRLREQTELCEKLGADINYFKERSQRLDMVTRKQVESENRSVLMERRAQELERKLATEVLEFQTQATTYRGEAKALAAELESLRNEMRRERDDRLRTDAENQRMTDQLESLQALWGESREQVETLELRLESLNKINQELSRKLKEQRLERENASLDLKPAQPAATVALRPQRRPQHDIEKLNKLDVLLATIGQETFDHQASRHGPRHFLDPRGLSR